MERLYDRLAATLEILWPMREVSAMHVVVEAMWIIAGLAGFAALCAGVIRLHEDMVVDHQWHDARLDALNSETDHSSRTSSPEASGASSNVIAFRRERRPDAARTEQRQPRPLWNSYKDGSGDISKTYAPKDT